MSKSIYTTIGITAILLGLSHPALAESADELRGTQSRTIKDAASTPATGYRVGTRTTSAKEIKNANGVVSRARIGERLELVRDRQGGERLSGVFPQGNLNSGDEVQVEYQLNRDPL